MSTLLAKRPASFMREHTQHVRDHSAAMARLTDQYVAALKRAEAQSFDGVKRITDAVTEATQPSGPEPIPDSVASDGQPSISA